MRFSLNPPVLSTSIAAFLGLALLGVRAQAQSNGVFSNSGALGFGDETANVGLNPAKTYLEAIDLGDTTDSTVNGVPFTGSGAAPAPSGTGWAITGTPNLFGGGGTIPGGEVGALTNKFIYGGLPATLTLSDLTVGQTYVVTLYNRSWDSAGQRVQNITASGASIGSTVFDEDTGASGQGNLNLLRYTFQAGSTTQSLSIAPQLVGNTMHLYGFSTEQTFNNTLTSGTTWSNATWSLGQPDGVGSNASFGPATAPTTFNLEGARTVGHLQFDGTNAWTLSGVDPLTLQADVGGVSVLSTLAGAHSISAPIVLNSDAVKLGAGSLSLNGTISGANGLNVSAGTLILGAANSYSGGTTVNNGATLQLGVAGALGATTGNLTVNGSGLVNLNGNTHSVGNLSGTGTISNNASGTNVTLTIGTGSVTDATFGGTIADHTTGTGTVALTKVDASTATLSGANSYSGLTTITAGKLQLDGAAAAGTLSTSGINIDAAGALGFTAGAGSTLSLKAGSTLRLGGGTIVMDVGDVAASDKISASTLALTANSAFAFRPISALDIGSTYTLASYNTLTNPNNFSATGSVIGRLTMTPVIGANAITMVPSLDSGIWNNPTGGTWSDGPWSNYTPTAAGDSALFGSALAANGTVSIDSARSVGYLTFNNGTASYTLGTAASSNLTIDNGDNRGIIDVNAGAHTILENVALASDLSVTADQGASLTMRGVISGAKGVSKFGQGTLILTNAHTYSGGTTILGGTLQLGNGVANGSVTGGILNNAALTFNNANAQTAPNAISGTGSVLKLGAGTLILSGASTFTGGLTISAGMVDVGGDTALGSVTGPILNNSTLRFSRTGVTTINSVVNGTGNTIIAGGVSQTLAAGASINTPRLTIGDYSQGYLYFSAPNQLNGTTGVLLTIGAHAANSRINLNGFSQTISGLIGAGIVQSAEGGTVAPATLTINVPGTNSYSWTGLIRNQATSGALSLTKTGTGEQVMNFAITDPNYTGATTVNQGRLVFGSTLAAPIWNTSGISVDAGAEVGLTGAGTGVVSWSEGVAISGAGGLTRTGADNNTVTITNRNNSFTGATKLSGTGILSVSSLANIGTNSAIGKGTAAANAASLILDGGKLRYTGAAVSSDRLFTLTQNGGTLDASGSAALNLTNSGAVATSGTGARNLILTGTNVGNNTLAAALSDGAGGGTSLTKNQEGTWVLTGASSYTGATSINAGRLQFNGNAAASPLTTLNLSVNSGGTLGFTSGTGGTLTLANTLTLNGGTTVIDLGTATGSDKITAGTLVIAADSVLRFNQIATYDFGSTYTLASYNTLTNPGNFKVIGFAAGRLTLNPVVGANAITLTPTLDNAVWNNSGGGAWSSGPWVNYTPNAVGDAALFGSALTSSAVVVVDSPKTAGYITFNNSAASYTIGTQGSANLTLANTGTAAAQITVTAGTHTIAEDVTLASDLVIFSNPSTTLNLNGALVGPANSVTKSGGGTVTLNGTNNFGTGVGAGFNINQGTVVLGSAAALASDTHIGVNGGTLDLNSNDTTIGHLSGSGGVVTDRSTAGGTTTLTIAQAGNSTFSGALSDGSARTLAVVKSGVGSLTLNGANTFSGGLTISEGSLIAANGMGIAVPGSVTLGTGIGSAWLISGASAQQYGADTVVTFNNGGLDAKLELRGTTQTLAGIDSSTNQNLSIIQNDEAASSGYTSAPGNATLILNTATDHSFYGIIRNQDGGALGITKEGVGTQELIAHSTIQGFSYSGPTIINKGQLILNLSGVPSANFASDITVNAGGTLGLDGNWTLSRPVNGAGDVIKQGFNAVTVSGALNHTGNTTIAAGSLILTGSLSGSPSIDVQNGAILDVSGVVDGFKVGAAQTLKGNGTVLGAVAVNGKLAPGNGIGTLTTDALAFGTASVLALEINTGAVTGLLGASDLVSVNGSFSLASGAGGSSTLSLTDLGGNVHVANNTQFTLVTYSGGWNGGLFNVDGNVIPDGGLFTFGANQFQLDYDAGGSNVVLTAVPEPTTAGALLAGLGTLLGLRRRRNPAL